ncbi:hypothetical protein POM88_035780 [Heracleum sosnowskyi]|uniref:PI3K/PI4K catalytic domain-containing protein n=1 Tax=Heracleum sosnowskyi TaxID=360622 RepID=A0AAD8HNV8_9APIA|nr:hypothetical protein POM88_035780 [Heracleum sosnowskyi]
MYEFYNDIFVQENEKAKAFQEVCKNFRPVMHYFFLESVAASLMVGYIVGLGDRHSMNILIDQATAEVVHTDLGAAFEHGLMLKTPERKEGVESSYPEGGNHNQFCLCGRPLFNGQSETPRPGLVTFDPHKYDNLSFTRQGTGIGLNKGDLRENSNVCTYLEEQKNFQREDGYIFACRPLFSLFVLVLPYIAMLSSQIITFEHEGNWSKALEYYDLQGRSEPIVPASNFFPENSLRREHCSFPLTEDEMSIRKPYEGQSDPYSNLAALMC